MVGLCTGAMDHRKTISIILLLLGSLQGYAKISSKVISLQQVLYTELLTLERSTLITHPSHTTPNEGVLSRLRSVFHEFERQNQESITAILRVLALVDHTLENTIQDCEKVFHLPSLDSENVLFRDVTRPLLLQVETLCEQIASKDFDAIEATMETVQQEAHAYRTRLDETKRNMQSVLYEVDNNVETFSMANKVDELFDGIEVINATIAKSVVASVESLLLKQQILCDKIRYVQGTNDDAHMEMVITSFMAFLQNETELLMEDLSEELDDWFNQTANLINAVEEELGNVPRDLMEAPIESFLENESSLKCLAEYGTRKAVESMRQGLASILQCFSIANDTEQPFEMVYHLLSQMNGDIQRTLEDILHCHQSTVRDDYNEDDFRSMASCFEMTKSILEAMQDFVDSKMDEIFFHVDISMYYNELKMESCVYYRAREMMLSVSVINQQYQKCNSQKEIEL